MTKPFCDICGKPACDITALHTQHTMPERTWTGYQSNGGCSGCDGRWIPTVWMHSHFRSINLTNDDYKERTPELCRECVIILAEKQLEELKRRE